MGLRQPSQIATFYKQAASGAEQQKKAREKLKQQTPEGQPVQALGGSAAAGTQMVAATTGAQQQATQQVKQKGQDLQAAVSGDKITTPTATATAYTGASSNVLGADAVQTSMADTIKDPSQVQEGTQTLKIFGKNFVIPKFVTKDSYESGIETLTQNQTKIQNSLDVVNDALKKHDEGVGVLSAQDLKNLQSAKEQLMTEWQKFDDAIRKENLGQIGLQSGGEIAMEDRERALAEEGGNIGKLASIFGPRFNARKYGALASQIYGKDLEAIQEAAAAGLKERDVSKQEAGAAEQQYISQLGTSKESVEKKVKTEQDKIDALNLGWEDLKNRGETLASLAKIFGSETEAKKYFNFDDKGNLVSDKRSKVREELVTKKDSLTKELEKTTKKVEEQKAKQLDAEFKPLAQNILGTFDSVTGVRKGGTLTKAYENLDKMGNVWTNQLDQYRKAEKEWLFRQHKGWSTDKWRIETKINIYNEFRGALANLETKLNQAEKDKDLKTMKDAQNQIDNLIKEYKRRDSEIPRPSKMVHVR